MAAICIATTLCTLLIVLIATDCAKPLGLVCLLLVPLLASPTFWGGGARENQQYWSLRIIYVASMWSALVLIVRLLETRAHFGGGSFCALDAGPKNTGGSNFAFEPLATTVGHTVQGMFVVFLWPLPSNTKISNMMERIPVSCRKCLFCFPSFLLTVYPTYNLVKRLLGAGFDFASSSYWNNQLEWTYGVLLGCAIGAALSTKNHILGDEDERTFRQKFVRGCAVWTALALSAGNITMYATWNTSTVVVPPAEDSHVWIVTLLYPPLFVSALLYMHYYRRNRNGDQVSPTITTTSPSRVAVDDAATTVVDEAV